MTRRDALCIILGADLGDQRSDEMDQRLERLKEHGPFRTNIRLR